jgi:uncharacterized protein YndB with AHSA1/START domain
MPSESFTVTDLIPASVERVFRAWLDAEEHARMTGSPATSEPFVGGRFTAWDGYIEGVHVAIDQNRRIVQTWRSSDFPEDHESSRLEVVFEGAADGTLVTVHHSQLPEGQGAGFEAGWRDYYFNPMKRYFSAAAVVKPARSVEEAAPAADLGWDLDEGFAAASDEKTKVSATTEDMVIEEEPAAVSATLRVAVGGGAASSASGGSLLDEDDESDGPTDGVVGDEDNDLLDPLPLAAITPIVVEDRIAPPAPRRPPPPPAKKTAAAQKSAARPAAKKPAAKQSAKPAAKKAAARPATKKPARKSATRPAAKKTAVKAASKQAAKKVTAKKAAARPATEKPARKSATRPAAKKTAPKMAAGRKPAAPKPATKKSPAKKSPTKKGARR